MKGKRAGLFSGWYLVVGIVFSIFDYIWVKEDNGILFTVLGGIENNYGEILLVPMGRWLFSFGLFLLITGTLCTKRKKMYVFEVHRYGSFGRWWFRQSLNIWLTTTVLFIEMVLIWNVLEVITQRQSEHIMVILITFWLHMSMMIIIEMCCSFLFSKGAIAGVLLILEGIGYVLAEQSGYEWLAGGMYVRSDKYLEGGFSICGMYIVEILLIAIAYLIVWLVGKFRGLECYSQQKQD